MLQRGLGVRVNSQDSTFLQATTAFNRINTGYLLGLAKTSLVLCVLWSSATLGRDAGGVRTPPVFRRRYLCIYFGIRLHNSKFSGVGGFTFRAGELDLDLKEDRLVR